MDPADGTSTKIKWESVKDQWLTMQAKGGELKPAEEERVREKSIFLVRNVTQVVLAHAKYVTDPAEPAFRPRRFPS